MMRICPEELCTGCFACLNSCVHNAIEIREDVVGFRYPVVDSKKCIGCGLCERTCPVNSVPERRFPVKGYATQMKETDELSRCASGGASTAIADYILKEGGVVYGCSGENIRQVRHIRIESQSELRRLQGSKYVQSEIGFTFRAVKEDLISNRFVLFVGTPCQVSGLKKYLRKDYDKLYTADLVCHGVPSQRLLNENIDDYVAKGYKIDEQSISFRRKNLGESQTQSARIEYGWFFQNQPYSKGGKSVDYMHDPYMFGFIQGLFFRPSCYKCAYAYAARVSDFTLSDYWGLGQDSKFELGKGVSSILVNTMKAQQLFDVLKTTIDYEQRDVQESIVGNGQLQRPSARHPQYNYFREIYPSLGLRKAVEICLKKDRLKIRLKKVLVVVRRLLSV